MVEYVKDLFYILKLKKNYRNIFKASQFIDFNVWAGLQTRQAQGQANKQGCLSVISSSGFSYT